MSGRILEPESIRVAIIHDWLVGMRGGERCLEVLCDLFPRAEIYTLFYDRTQISPGIRRHRVSVSNLGKLPLVNNYYRHLLPVYQLGIASLSRKLAQAHAREKYDLVISINHCVAKNISVPPQLRHICYCLTPARYLYDQYDAYFLRSKLEPIIRRIIARLRHLDIEKSASVESFIAISRFVSERIKHAYGRASKVIFPPVDTSWITPRAEGEKGEGFLCVSALVPYKNVDLIVSAFNFRQEKLIIVGRGPELIRLKALARPNIEFREYVSEEELAALYRGTKALVFAAEEDFGITPVEAQAAGRPVIAYAKGGVLETVIGAGEGATGVLFNQLSARELNRAIDSFLDRENDYTVKDCVKNAKHFSRRLFENNFVDYLVSLGVLTHGGKIGVLRKVC